MGPSSLGHIWQKFERRGTPEVTLSSSAATWPAFNAKKILLTYTEAMFNVKQMGSAIGISRPTITAQKQGGDE
jgi:hypothetical protein